MAARETLYRFATSPSDSPPVRASRAAVSWSEVRDRGRPSFLPWAVARLRPAWVRWVRTRGKVRSKSPWLAAYSFEHVMELALALTLRVYNAVPDVVLRELIDHREELCRLYRQAYVERSSGLGRPTKVKGAAASYEVKGAFLDLGMDFSGGTLTAFGPPSLLSPEAAMEAFAQSPNASRAFLPIRLSELADRVAELASRAPAVRSGPRPKADGTTAARRAGGVRPASRRALPPAPKPGERVQHSGVFEGTPSQR